MIIVPQSQTQRLEIEVAGVQVYLSPGVCSSTQPRSLYAITHAADYTIPLVRVACPADQVLIDGACYMDCALVGQQRSATDLFTCTP